MHRRCCRLVTHVIVASGWLFILQYAAVKHNSISKTHNFYIVTCFDSHILMFLRDEKNLPSLTFGLSYFLYLFVLWRFNMNRKTKLYQSEVLFWNRVIFDWCVLSLFCVQNVNTDNNNDSEQVSVDLLLRPRGQWDRRSFWYSLLINPVSSITIKNKTFRLNTTTRVSQ